MKIGQKLILGFVGITFLIGIVSVVGTTLINANIVEIVQRENPKMQAFLEMQINAKEMTKNALDFLKSGKPGEKQEFNKNLLDFEMFNKIFEQRIMTVEERKVYNDLADLFDEYKNLAEQLIILKENQAERIEQRRVLLSNGIEFAIRDKLYKNLNRFDPYFKIKQEALLKMEMDVRELISAVSGNVLRYDAFLKERMHGNLKHFKYWCYQFLNTEVTVEEKRLFGEIMTRLKEVEILDYEFLGLEDKKQALLQKFEENGPKIDSILGGKFRIITLEKIRLAEGKALNITRIILITCISVIFLAVMIGLFISHSISSPITRLKEAVAEIGKGKLDTRLEINSRDEVGFLANAFNKMAENLVGLIEKEKQIAATAAAEVEHKRAAELEKAYKELEKAQGELIQSEKMSAVGKLASGVAHEVKNPLAIIIQGVNYLEEKLHLEENDYSKILQMIKANVRRADNIVRALLDFSRASKLNLVPEDINSILKSSLVLVQHRTKLEDIEIVEELNEGLPKVLADKGKMEQVFVNLFLNAIQAMPNGGRLSICSYIKRLNEPINRVGKGGMENYFKAGESVVVIEAEDTGVGIPEEHLEKIADPFYTTKNPGEGTGLGLSVTKNIIDLHKGIMEIKSIIGKGTKIIVTLKKSGGLND